MEGVLLTRAVKLFLARSDPWPFELHFDNDLTLEAGMLETYFSRIESIFIGGSALRSASQFMDVILSRPGQLRVKHLYVSGPWTTDAISRCLALHEKLFPHQFYDPKKYAVEAMISLKTSGCCFHRSPIPYASFSSLVNLNLDPVFPDRSTLCRIFESAPRLECLALALDFFSFTPLDMDPTQDPTPIHAPPSLHSLAVQFSTTLDDSCISALVQLQIPSLKYLELCDLGRASLSSEFIMVLRTLMTSSSLSRVRCHVDDNPSRIRPSVHCNAYFSDFFSLLPTISISHSIDFEFFITTLSDLRGFIPDVFYARKIRNLTLRAPVSFVDAFKHYTVIENPDKQCEITSVLFRVSELNSPEDLDRCATILRDALGTLLGSKLQICIAGSDRFTANDSLLGPEQIHPSTGDLEDMMDDVEDYFDELRDAEEQYYDDLHDAQEQYYDDLDEEQFYDDLRDAEEQDDLQFDDMNELNPF